MKKFKIIYTILTLLISIQVFSQLDARTGSNEGVVRGSNIKGGIYRNKSAFQVKPLGSPYNSTNFQEVKVEHVIEKAKMRFNIYNDEFEFILPTKDTLILDKTDDFNNLIFVQTNVKYRLVNYTNVDLKNVYGYLIETYQKGAYNLFKKERIQYNEEKIARTSLETNMPAKFYKIKSLYFLSSKGITKEFPTSRKKLTNLFPDKKEVIEKFLKENKIDFDSETDLKKLIDLIAGF
jgi:hypothetical protein